MARLHVLDNGINSGLIMKFLLLFVFTLFSCATTKMAASTDSCKNLNKEHEAYLLKQYTELGKITEKCYWCGITTSWHVTKEDRAERYYNSCEPMPEIVKVKCFSNCLSGKAGCIIFYADGYTMTSVN